ncbi:MAG TPA: Rho termination factor N-terminal domain-containing protein [Solirubrobacteraceae bacterium]|nr:Rho termination factor N-terminal domain-containing protein [Solirubrobacteraceae bacterium]
MSVLDRDALEASPLADLHTIASELSLDGYRRLRKAVLIDAIIARQTGTEPAGDAAEPVSVDAPSDAETEETESAARRRRGRRGGRGRTGTRDSADGPAEAEEAPAAKEPENPVSVEGVVELLANGSGFLRVSPPEPSDEDVYISAAQVKRCELVSGDRVSGPRRPPQRSERFASLVRIDTINGQPASEVADRARYDELAATFPAERFKFASEDPTLKAIEFLTPIGRGSRVVLCGGPWAGKSHTLRQLAALFAADAELSVFVALIGVRPEELSDWTRAEAGLPAPDASLSFAASADAQDHAVELVIEQAKRIATRGGHAVVLIDTLEGLHAPSARKALAAARNFVDAGSLTVIATASRPLGGETTVISLDAALASINRFPALELANSGTLRPELLVGEAGAAAIAEARAEAFGA